MKIRERIEKKGFKVTSNMGWKDGVQIIESYSASKNGHTITAPSLTVLLKKAK